MESATWATVYYRLAPENTYPAATEDSLLALNHLVHEMGLGRGGIHVVGISAGGTLAMETTMKSLDLVDTFFVDEPPVPLPTSDEKWSMDSPSFRRYSYSRQVPTTWLEWSLKAYTGIDTVHDIEKDLRLGTIATGVDITGGSMNVSEWVKRTSSASLPKLILVTAKGDPLKDGGLAFKDVYERVIQAAEAKNSSMSGGVPRIKHFETSSGHVGFYLFEPEVFQNIVTEWYFDIHRAWERKNSINIDS
jgi:acetyl esterase/lipase